LDFLSLSFVFFFFWKRNHFGLDCSFFILPSFIEFLVLKFFVLENGIHLDDVIVYRVYKA